MVDDEAPARARMRLLLGELGLSEVREASSVKDALARLSEEAADVILLDIHMPLLDGFDLADLLPEPKPAVVFVTAYAEHAVKAFDVAATDYLTKPVRKERLEQALARCGTPVREAAAGHMLRRITAERANTLHVLDVDGCAVFHAEDKLTFVNHGGVRHRVAATLDELESRLDPARFLRIHRHALVNLDQVAELHAWFAGAWRVKLKDGTEWDVARRRVGELKARLGG
jgi:two-component system LytT family response regulator